VKGAVNSKLHSLLMAVIALLENLLENLRQSPFRLSLCLAFGSGIGMGLATAPLNAFPLAWVALVPLWVMVGQAGKRREKLGLALAWGFGYHGLALAWITGLHPLTFLGIPWAGSVAIVAFCWFFISFWGAALVAIWAGGTIVLAQKLPAWAQVLVATALWCGLESLWSQGSLYWSGLSYTQSPGNLPLLHLGQLSGASIVTGAIVAVNGLLAIAWNSRQSERKSYLGLAILLLCGLHLGGYVLYAQPLDRPPATALKVGIVQGNVPTRIKLSEEGLRRAVTGYVSGYEQLAAQGADAVLTPEGALPMLWGSDRNPFYQAVRATKTPAWLGTFVPEADGITQSLLTLDSRGQVLSRYNKIKLVPLGEFIPFKEVLGGLIGRLSSIRFGMIPGTADQRFDTPFGRAIASICYESAFPELFRAQAADGGEFILTVSNLDPYSEVLMAQHQAQDVMRAIETDRWAARATNTGYSGFLNPHGQVVWRSQPLTFEAHAETIYRRQTQTLYVRWGDWFTRLMLGLAAIVLGYSKFRSRRA
jgi:apolipoprotein N-acyltransferase